MSLALSMPPAILGILECKITAVFHLSKSHHSKKTGSASSWQSSLHTPRNCPDQGSLSGSQPAAHTAQQWNAASYSIPQGEECVFGGSRD